MLEPKWIFDDQGKFQEIQWVEQENPVCLSERLKKSLRKKERQVKSEDLPKAS